jgi:hypothetical protein
VVEVTRLESERTGNRTVGSNPTLSATLTNFQQRIKINWSAGAPPAQSDAQRH